MHNAIKIRIEFDDGLVYVAEGENATRIYNYYNSDIQIAALNSAFKDKSNLPQYKIIQPFKTKCLRCSPRLEFNSIDELQEHKRKVHR